MSMVESKSFQTKQTARLSYFCNEILKVKEIQTTTQSVILYIQGVGEQGIGNSDLGDAGQNQAKQRKRLKQETN